MASSTPIALAISLSKRTLNSSPLASKTRSFNFKCFDKTPQLSLSCPMGVTATGSLLQAPMASTTSSILLATKAATTTPSSSSLLMPAATSSLLVIPKATLMSSSISPRNFHSRLAPPFMTEPYAISSSSDGDSDDGNEENIFMVEEIFKNPFVNEGSELPSDLKEDDEAVYARFDMPGIGKEGLKLYMEKSTMTLRIKGEEGEKEPEYNKEETGARKYSTSLCFSSAGCFMTDKIRASMKDGVLRVVVPKIQLEAKMDVIPVSVN